MDSIILSLLVTIQYQYKVICQLTLFIAKYIPLKQWAFDDSHSPKYQKFKTDILPNIICHKSEWDWQSLQKYYLWRYGKEVPPAKRRKPCDIPEDYTCACCGAPKPFLYKNNGSKGQIRCKVCQTNFSPNENRFSKDYFLKCPYCDRILSPVKNRKHFIVHKCVNKKCPYYLNNLKEVDKNHLDEQFGKNRYKLHYIYREFTISFFKMDLDSLPKNVSSLKFRKHSAHIMTLALTFNVNLGLSLRHTSQALRDLYGIGISHTVIANYLKTAATVIKPFVDHYEYERSLTYIADETYIKIRALKGYVWLIMDAVSRSILGYQVSDNRGVGPCILTMRMAFRGLKELPKGFKFIADGYSAYPLASQQFALRKDNPLNFNITQVIGLTNDDEVSKEFRPFKQMVERLNRTFKASYRVSCGFDNYDGANYSVALWVAYYNFLRPHKSNSYQPLNKVTALGLANTMPGKWQLLLRLGQEKILELQAQQAEG